MEAQAENANMMMDRIRGLELDRVTEVRKSQGGWMGLNFGLMGHESVTKTLEKMKE